MLVVLHTYSVATFSSPGRTAMVVVVAVVMVLVGRLREEEGSPEAPAQDQETIVIARDRKEV